ncbi:hypothetical protein K470DRAFT_70940 [Piedraia hortae CBS 480.64]|uniref:Oxysterol-binding protein n=1 Tax=Piedraia hortae CBS 480.64 TaxID=1314780 RepID=A0A6A7BZG2_9PEZI|nr:hypothetical protein K470DRAFT_70940 [Piedraia hortae CBS 480.64]
MSDPSQATSLKQLLASLTTIKGDLSNITAPPFVLAPKSTTEFPRYWIAYPSLFVAPAKASSQEMRMVAVLKWFLASLKGQQYAGGESIKKPLNAFLGELFMGECGQGDALCRLVSEQVSHHPPITACYLWNAPHGVRAQGFAEQEITLTAGGVEVRQSGHAIVHLDRTGEDYTIPLPNVRVKGILTGSPYPELHGTYDLRCSNGLVAEISFSGKKGLLLSRGEKNHVHARVYRTNEEDKTLFIAEGSWSDHFEITDEAGNIVDRFSFAEEDEPFSTLPLEEQDPFESRKAWAGVISAIEKGDMQGVVNEKSKLENAQRKMRGVTGLGEKDWEPLFFTRVSASEAQGDWQFDLDRSLKLERPYRGELTPFG